MSRATPAAQLASWFAWPVFLGVCYFFLVAAVLQFLRPDYSFVGTPISFYLLGPYSGWLHVAFYVLAAAIALLAVGCYVAGIQRARTSATLILFIAGAAGVVVTATFPTDVTNKLTVHGAVHILGALIAFLCVSVGMLLQSWYYRQDTRWRPHFRTAMGLAVFEFIVLWVYAFERFGARGLMEKLTIALILLWLALAAWWLHAPAAHLEP